MPFDPESTFWRRVVAFLCPKDASHAPITFAEPSMQEYFRGYVPVRQQCRCVLTESERQVLMNRALVALGLLPDVASSADHDPGQEA
jgi:hypothetical protein